MAGENEQISEVVVDEATALADAEAGYSGDVVTAPAPTPAEADAVAAPAADPPVDPVVDPPPAESEYVQVTKADFEKMQAIMAEWPSWKKSVSSVSGVTGGLKSQLQELRTAMSVTGGDPDFTDLAEDFPELTDRLKKAFEPLKKRGNAPALSPEALRTLAEEVSDARELRTIEAVHSGWIDTVGPINGDNDFRRWLATKSPDYANKVNNSRESAFLIRVLDTFERETEARPKTPAAPPARATPPAAVKPAAAAAPARPVPPTPQQTRQTIIRNRMRAGVPPQGAGALPNPASQSAEEAAIAAYNSA